MLSFILELASYFAETKDPIIVTGATGWLGRVTLEMLDSALNNNLQSRVHAFSSSDCKINLRSGKQVISKNLKTLPDLNLPPAIIFHYAFLTREHALTQPFADYENANNEITRIMSDAVNRMGARGIFIPSSGAVYGIAKPVDRDSLANPYGILKRKDEITFQTLAKKLGFPCAVIRIFNLSGPFINKHSSYALASIIQDIISGGPIILRAKKPVIRSYAYAEDVINIAAAAIKRDSLSSAIDTAGKHPVEIGDLAKLAAQTISKSNIEIIRPDISEADRDFYCGDGHSYFELAKIVGLEPKSLAEQIRSTAHYLKSHIRP